MVIACEKKQQKKPQIKLNIGRKLNDESSFLTCPHVSSLFQKFNMTCGYKILLQI